MPKSGNLYISSDKDVYVLLTTPLGWIAMDTTDNTCFGVPRRDVNIAVDSLTDIGLTLDLTQSKMIDNA